MAPTATCPICHGERIDPRTKDLPEDDRELCPKCHGAGELFVTRIHDIRILVAGERMARRLEAA